jgi:adenylate cyclase
VEPQHEDRRLITILAADVVGYSRLMAADESMTLAQLKTHRRELIEPKTDEHHGRVVKLMGDGTLMEFGSVVDAVNFAIDIQKAMAKRNADVPDAIRIVYRFGINIGDIIVEGDDIYGDGVNVAARLEQLAEPGGICIARNVFNQVKNKVEITFQDMGEQELKNIPDPVMAYRIVMSEKDVGPAAVDAAEPLALPDKPSIAVLPFDNMSGDAEQEYFADGIAEDVITALSRFRSLFVIARNSSFTYKGRAIDITEVARDLGVRYVVEGSVRKAGNRVRITAQLIDAFSGNHLWADRFDGSLDDVFDLQDQITEQIVVAIEPEIGVRERERAGRKPPESLDAWELLQRGLSHFYRAKKTDRIEAIRLFREAIALDPKFAAAHAHLAWALSSSVRLGYFEDTAKAVTSARAAAERAASLDPNEPVARYVLGRVHIFAGEPEMAIDEMQSAISINANFGWGYYGLCFAYHYGAGQAEQALPHFDAALQLSPRDPSRWSILSFKGSVLRDLGRHDEAIAYCRQSCQIPDAPFAPYMHLAAALAEAGQISEARVAVERATQLQSALSISFIRSNYVGAHETYLNGLLDSLRKAGVPE